MKKFKKDGNKRIVEKTRKQLRKEKRQQKKINRAHYYELKRKIPGRYVLNPGDLHTEEDDVNKNINNKNNSRNDSDRSLVKSNSNENNQKNSKKIDDVQKQLKKEKQQLQSFEKQMKNHRKLALKEDNEKEDKVIKRLEKQLKLNKRKSKNIPKSFTDDGLDYLLDFCNDENRKLAVETEKKLLGIDDDDFQHDFEMVTNGVNNKSKKSKIVAKKFDNDELSDDNSNIDDDEVESDEIDREELSGKKSEKFDNSSNDDLDMDDDDDEISMTDDQDDSMTENFHECDNNSDEKCEEEEEDEENDCSEEKNEIWEDIYGRKRDKVGNILTNSIGKYVPPAARMKDLEKNSAEQEKLLRLKKQLKGHINRLAEFNMHGIASQIEELYMSNSRNDMNELLSALMMESIVAPVITPDRLIAEHMMLIAILHANVGTEVGAHFLLTLVRRIDEMMNAPQDVENKEIDNLMCMLSHLYNFKVFASQLLYQILHKLSEQFSEKEIELILLILKNIGFLLRKDDPVALKELVLNLQAKAKSVKSSNSRIQFMLDILLAIKNNNMSKIPQYDPTHVEHLKKLIKSFLRKGNTITQLNISLSDLLKANERGKWWIVGSAWTGTIDSVKSAKKSNVESAQFSDKLLELARKQRMNTDIRRNLFCILMTAEDYLDAFEKIHHLGLKGQQEREIINVIIKCCLYEKTFNPYYAVLAQKFCDSDRKYQMTVQYSLWDKLKILNDANSTQIYNLSKFLTYLFIERGLSLSALKVVQFGELDKPIMRLIRQIMLEILLHDNTEACLEVFERISVSPQLQTLREGLRLFISHFLVKNADSKKLPVKELETLKERAELVEKILYNRSSKIIY